MQWGALCFMKFGFERKKREGQLQDIIFRRRDWECLYSERKESKRREQVVLKEMKIQERWKDKDKIEKGMENQRYKEVEREDNQ